ncbi:MAG: histidine phosphatase family protein [Actinomycetota bacterium]
MSEGQNNAGATTRLLVLRHGQSEWNAEGRWQGQADIKLTDQGIAQAKLAATKLGGFDLIATSTLQRARHTAEIIAAHLDHDQLHVDERLKESSIGPWQGLTYAEIEAGWPGYLNSRRQPEGFEPNSSVVGRMTAAFIEIADKCRGGQALVISHSGVIRTLRRELRVNDTRLENLGGSWFEIDGNNFVRAGRMVAVIGELDSADSL